MTATLFVFAPVGLLAIVAAFGFVGCFLDSGPYDNSPPPPYTTYSDDDVIANSSCVAYWPLNDGFLAEDPAKTKAVDVVGTNNGSPHDGTYVTVETQPPLFPCPDFVVSPAEPITSASAPGSLVSGAPGIVPGDAMQPLNDPKVLRPSVQVDGAFVEVPFFADINLASNFTIECWVRPEWDGSGATRAIIDSRGQANGAVTGFVLWVNDAGDWEALFNGTNGGVMRVTAGPAALTAATYVVLTFGDTSASLFINAEKAAGPTALPPGSTYTPNGNESLIIGAGFRFLPPRTQPSDDLFFPLIPFKGRIQDVAVYNTVLSDSTIDTHFKHGMGKRIEGDLG